MGLFDIFRRDDAPSLRSESEVRSLIEFPWDSTSPFSVNRVPAVSQDRALTLAPVYSAVSRIAGDISTLPVKAYRRLDDERVPMGKLPQLFDRLVTDGTIVVWLHQAMTSLLLRGNAFGLVLERDGFGFPIEIVWLDPSRVTDDGILGRPGWRFDGRPVPREDIVHLTKFVVAGQTQGLSPVGLFAQTIGIGLHASGYGSDFFANGGHPPGLFRNTEQPIPDNETAAVIKARLGAAMRTREPLVYGKDWEFTPLSVSPAEAQFLETIRANATTVASIYHVPAEMIGGDTGRSLTYSTEELNQIKYISHALRPWLVTLEAFFSALLPDRQYIRFNSDALIRTDIKTRSEVMLAELAAGVLSKDEYRKLLDRPPLPNGLGDFKETAPAVPAPPVAAVNNVVPIQKVSP